MCVPVPVTNAQTGQKTVNKQGEVTNAALPAPSRNLVNQMMVPFQAALQTSAKGGNLAEQQKAFNDPKSLAALLTPPAAWQAQLAPVVKPKPEDEVVDRKKGTGVPVAGTVATTPKPYQGRPY